MKMSGRKSFAWLAMAAALLPLVAAVDRLPAPLKRCRVEDEACLVRQAQSFVATFKHGIPERGVPGFEPIKLGTLRISNGGPSDSMQFNLVMTDTTLQRFADTVVFKSVKGFSRDLTKPLKLSWTTSATGIEVYAKYDVNGKILILPIVSKGNLVITLNQLLAKTRVSAVPEKRPDGHTYLKVTDYKTVAKSSSGHFNMSNLFDDNVELRESTLKVLNDEWAALSVDIQPKILEAADRMLVVILQKFLDTLPYDEFFEN